MVQVFHKKELESLNYAPRVLILQNQASEGLYVGYIAWTEQTPKTRQKNTDLEIHTQKHTQDTARDHTPCSGDGKKQQRQEALTARHSNGKKL